MFGRWVTQAVRPGYILQISYTIRSGRNGWKTVADMPVKHFDMQAAMKTHLSQSTGTGAFDGQHGISLAISSVVADRDISSAIACIEPWEGAPAMTGWETGANARPAIIKTASSRRMATLRFTRFNLVRLRKHPRSKTSRLFTRNPKFQV